MKNFAQAGSRKVRLPAEPMDFFEEIAHRNAQRALSVLLRILISAVIVLGLSQVALLGWVATQCTNVHGISVDGRIFKTHSFSCPDPSVRPIHWNKAN